jgi:hypothetical protein
LKGVLDESGRRDPPSGLQGRRCSLQLHPELIVPRDPERAGRAALRAEAERLCDWLDREKVSALYKSPLVTWDR